MPTPVPPQLTADCSRCFGLCCVLLPLTAGADFAVDKPAGVACQHLDDHDRCRIHARLRETGWAGCASFDCFGAGQQVAQVTYAGRSWREREELSEMTAVLTVMRQLHEMLHHLGDVDRHGLSPTSYHAVLDLTSASPGRLLDLDVDALRERVRRDLDECSRAVRVPTGPSHAYADLAGADVSERDLARADLRGALLIAADLRGTDLTDADLLGADLRDARVAGAALDALFLTQTQLNSARGDATTAIPARLSRPDHWV